MLAAVMGEPVAVEVVPDGEGWRLLRGGQAYEIRGVGYTGELDALAAGGREHRPHLGRGPRDRTPPG